MGDPFRLDVPVKFYTPRPRLTGGNPGHCCNVTASKVRSLGVRNRTRLTQVPPRFEHTFKELGPLFSISIYIKAAKSAFKILDVVDIKGILPYRALKSLNHSNIHVNILLIYRDE